MRGVCYRGNAHRNHRGLQQRVLRLRLDGDRHLRNPHRDAGVSAHRPVRHAGAGEMTRLRELIREISRNPNAIAYAPMAKASLTFPAIPHFSSPVNAHSPSTLPPSPPPSTLHPITLHV